MHTVNSKLEHSVLPFFVHFFLKFRLYFGNYFFNASSDLKPGIFDENWQEIIDPSEFYSGCYGRASVTMYPYDVSGSKGIGYGLSAVKKTEEGEKLGGATASAADFAADFAV